MSKFFLNILTPTDELFRDHVESALVPAMDGVCELLPNHAPTFIALTSGELSATQSGEIEQWSIGGGTCHMQGNVCTIMVTQIIE